MLRLVLREEENRKELTRGNLQEVVRYLKEDYEDLFEWINSSPWRDDGSPEIELPELNNIETVRDLRKELNKVDLGWWTLGVEEITEA